MPEIENAIDEVGLVALPYRNPHRFFYSLSLIVARRVDWRLSTGCAKLVVHHIPDILVITNHRGLSQANSPKEYHIRQPHAKRKKAFP